MKLPVSYRYQTDTDLHVIDRAVSVHGPGQQTGVALITVLLIVFLASMTAISLASLQQMAIRRSTILQHQQQARLYTFGIEQWTQLILARDRKKNAIDHPGEPWAKLPPTLPVKEGVLTGRLRDLQGCFNLNSLWQPTPSQTPTNPANPSETNPQNQPTEGGQSSSDTPKNDNSQATKTTKTTEAASTTQDTAAGETAAAGDAATASAAGEAKLDEAQFQMLQRLLINLELKPELAQAIVDWMDPDQDPLFPDGAEDGDYTILTPPYLAANRPFSSVSELRLVKGVDQEVYDKLAPWVCTLPSGTALNVNTASAPVLAALSEGLSPKDMEQLLENRPEEGYKTVDDFLNAAKITLDAPLKARLSVNTDYFALQAEAHVGDGHAMLYSILYRTPDRVRVIWRSFGHQN